MLGGVEFFDGNPIHINLPEKVSVKIKSTTAPIKGGTDSIYKEATLENGTEILVPLFIKTGDTVLINVETGEYISRAKD